MNQDQPIPTPRMDKAVNAGGNQLLNVTKEGRTLERDLWQKEQDLQALYARYTEQARKREKEFEELQSLQSELAKAQKYEAAAIIKRDSLQSERDKLQSVNERLNSELLKEKEHSASVENLQKLGQEVTKGVWKDHERQFAAITEERDKLQQENQELIRILTIAQRSNIAASELLMSESTSSALRMSNQLLDEERKALTEERDKLREALLGTYQLVKGEFSTQLEVDVIMDAAREALNLSKSSEQ